MLRLLVPLDGSACAERVLSHAFTLAHAFSASVRLLRVVPTDRRPDSAVRRFDRGLERRQSHLYLEPIAERFRNGGIPAEVVVEEGSPAAVITAAARSCADQLLVMATHGRGGAYEFPRGSVASKVLANYHDSVFLLRPQAAPSSGRYRRITAIVDLSTRSRAVVQSAARIAESQGAGLLIACALRTSELPAALRANSRAAALNAELAGLKQEAARAALRDYRESLPPAVPVESKIVPFSDLQSAVSRIGVHHEVDLLVIDTEWPDVASGRRTESAPMLIVGPHGLQVERVATPASSGRPPQETRLSRPRPATPEAGIQSSAKPH